MLTNYERGLLNRNFHFMAGAPLSSEADFLESPTPADKKALGDVAIAQRFFCNNYWQPMAITRQLPLGVFALP